MELTKNGVTIQVNEAEIISMIVERLSEDRYAFVATSNETPRIGQPWPGQGGIYAGMMRSREGGADYHLIVGPEYEGETDWKAATDWAVSLNVKMIPRDYSLPTRAEQALQFANVPELFKREWYWSSEQHAEGAGYAWCQDFGFGSQSGSLKDGKLRARAVRRLTI